MNIYQGFCPTEFNRIKKYDFLYINSNITNSFIGVNISIVSGTLIITKQLFSGETLTSHKRYKRFTTKNIK